jgi:hypothetical protein
MDHDALVDKVEFLEILVCALFRAEFSKAPNPIQAMDAFYERFKGRLEAASKQVFEDNDSQGVMSYLRFTLMADDFFTQLRSEIK